MRILIDDIQGLVSKFGKSIVLDKKFLNMLKDVYNFRENPKLLNILEELYAQGQIVKIYKSSKKRIEKDINSILLSNRKQKSFKKDDIAMVLYSFAIGINIIGYDDYIALKDKGQNEGKCRNAFIIVKSLFKRLCCSIDRTNVRIVLSFLLASFIGLILFFICEENRWWIFFCTIILSIGDLITVGCWADKSWLDNLNKKSAAIFCACGTIGALKSCLPLFYFKGDTSILSLLLIFGIIFLWGYFTVEVLLEHSKACKWQQIIYSKTYIVTTLLMLLMISSFVFLAPIRAFVENEINNRIKQKYSQTERNLKYKTFYLNQKIPYATNGILGLNKRMGIDSLGAKIDVITFKDKLYTDSADVELIMYKEKLVKITINSYSLGMSSSEEILKLYIGKYGTPEKQQRPIDFFENPLSMFIHPWSWYTHDFRWSYKNGTINISCDYLIPNSISSISYISSTYLGLEYKERAREDNEIKAKERKEKQLEEISNQRYKNEIKKEEVLKKQSYSRTEKDI